MSRTSSVESRSDTPIMPPASSPIHAEHDHSSTGDILKLIFCAGGILVCYFVFGGYQEAITKGSYGSGENAEKFVYTQALVFVQCVVNCAFAAIIIRVVRPAEDTTPPSMYALCSFSYLGAMIASNHALQYVAYPTQVLGKSCKPVPVMLFGVLFARKRYALRKYAFVLLIVAGVALFLFKEKASSSTTAEHTLGWGEILLCLSLAMDGTTGAVQDRIRASHKMVSHRIMYNMNLWGSAYLTVGLLLTGELVDFWAFVGRHPSVVSQLALLSLASSLGQCSQLRTLQFFIFKTIELFGPLTCSIVTTTRKFFTMLISVFLFGHVLTSRQWLGTVLVFTGLACDTMWGKTPPAKLPAVHKA